MSEDFSAAEPLLAEYADIEAEMAGPAAADPGAMRRLGRATPSWAGSWPPTGPGRRPVPIWLTPASWLRRTRTSR